VSKPLSPLNRFTALGEGNAEFGRAMALIGIFGIWYASNTRARRLGCEDIATSFHRKARGALTAR